MPVRRMPARRLAAACAAASLPVLLAACGGSSSSSSTSTNAAGTTTTTKVQQVSLQLDWTPNTNHTGFYVAAKNGYYKAAGVDLKILPYSDAGADTIVGAGKADCGITSQDNLPVASVAGTKEVSVMPILQHQVNALMVKAGSSYQRPKDLSGKTYGGFGLPYETAVVNQMIKNDGGSGNIKNVVLNTGAYQAVYSGKVDTSMGFETWELIEAAERNIKLRTFPLLKYGIPDTYNVLLACNADWLKNNPALAKKFVGATAKGFQFAIDNPSGAAKVLIDANPGVFSNPKLVYASADLLAKKYYADPNGKFGCQTLARWSEYPKWLYGHGILKDPNGKALSSEPNYATFFTTAYEPAACAGTQ
jgi:ABC-type nitrate/sulfonate/bicarbonate transport system substrate-binding protein